MRIAGYHVPLFASLIVWAILWEVLGRLGATLVMPPLSAIIVRMIEIVPTPTFAAALWITGKTFIIGVVIAVAVGVPMASQWRDP
jgi:NitT/TauT family transport system permease protein